MERPKQNREDIIFRTNQTSGLSNIELNYLLNSIFKPSFLKKKSDDY